MKNTMLALSLNGIMFGLIKLFYELVPKPMSALLYCTFLGFTVTFAAGARVRETAAYLGSIFIGIVWVMGYIGFEAVFLVLAMPESGVKGLAFGCMSFVIEALNLLIIGKTRFKYVPLQFAVVIGIFSQQCRHIPSVLAALMIGVLAALLSRKIYVELLPSPNE